MDTTHPSLVEAMGLRPLGLRLGQTLVALRGTDDVPPTRLGLSSLRTLRPRLAIPLWMGRFFLPRTVLLTHLFNHRQTPVEAGWSVRRTQVEDFRGGELTYDSHNGTDLSVPVGTLAVAPASGVVARVFSEFNRGGLKVVIDHGDGLMTCSAHLARALVEEGQPLVAGQPYAVTGYSGLDGMATFPWGVPHIHFNVWLDGLPVDPFPRAGTNETSLWIDGWPRPVPRPPRPKAPRISHPPPTPERLAGQFNNLRVDAIISACRSPQVRAHLEAIGPLHLRAAHLVSELCYYPTRFPEREGVYRARHPRRPSLHLPFQGEDIHAVAFADEI